MQDRPDCISSKKIATSSDELPPTQAVDEFLFMRFSVICFTLFENPIFAYGLRRHDG